MNYIKTRDLYKRDLYINQDSIAAFTVEELNTNNVNKFNIEITLVTGNRHDIWLQNESEVEYILNQILKKNKTKA